MDKQRQNGSDTFAKRVSERTTILKDNAADFIKRATSGVKSTAVVVKDKTAVFLSDLAYNIKGMMFNTYDKTRFFIAEHKSESDPDLIAYKGEPKPKASEAVKTYASSKVSAVKTVSLTDMKLAMKKTSREASRSVYRMKKACKSAKVSMVEFFAAAKEYAQGIRKSTVIGAGSVAVAGIAIALVLTTVINSYAMGVTINGQKVGFVENEDELSSMVEKVEKELSEENNNAVVHIDEDAIELDSLDEPKSEVSLMDQDTLKENIVNANAMTATATAINVNGKPVLYVGNKSEAKAVLEAIKDKYNVSGEDVIMGFKENVTATAAPVSVNDVKASQSAINYLLTGNETIKKYKVKEDDTDWDIAKANGLTEKELQKMNPDIDTTVIKKGDVLNITKMQPHVHMEVIATVSVNEKINYKTKKIKSDKMYVGETKVKKEGKRGTKTVLKRSVFINGKEKSFQLIREDVQKKPVNRVVIVGTKAKAGSSGGYGGGSGYSSGGGGSYVSGSGTLSNPLRSMTLSSPFGYRNGRMHTGLDLRNPAGTSIYAAAGGTVTSAGWDGAYGYCVKISHGGGLSTLYGHCSALYVKSGQSVSRGQCIAAVGSTGRSTGNHLHFEVRVNGTPVNPYGYL